MDEIEQALTYAVKEGLLEEEEATALLNDPQAAEEWLSKVESNPNT